MRRESAAPQEAVRRIWLALLALAVILSAGRVFQLRHYGEFVDETVELTTGWLLTKGDTLYGTLFSHHMPLASAIAQAIAWISPTDDAAHFRIGPWLAYLLLAAALARSPFERARPGWGLAAATVFLILISLFGPLVSGQMLLNDTLWGVGFAIFFLQLILPLILGLPVRPGDAVAGGIAVTLAAAGSPLSLFPAAACGAAALLRCRPDGAERRFLKLGLPFVTSALATALVAFLWLTCFGRLSGFIEQVVDFNAEIYSRFLGAQETPGKLLASAVVEWFGYLGVAVRHGFIRGSIDARFALPVLVFCAILGWRTWKKSRGRLPPLSGRLQAMTLSVMVVLAVIVLRLRGGGFRALPFYILVLALGSVFLAESFFSERNRKVLLTLLLVLPFAPLASAAVRHESMTWNVSRREEISGPFAPVADYIRQQTTPDERIAAFPVLTRVYLDALRRPATDSIYFLPWQALWEESRPVDKSTCSQLRSARPRFVVIRSDAIWGEWPWESYGACIDRFVKENYAKLPDERFRGLLWERSDVLADEKSRAVLRSSAGTQGLQPTR